MVNTDHVISRAEHLGVNN